MNKIKIKDIAETLTDYVANGSFAALRENVNYQKEGYARLIRLVDYNKNFSEDDSIWVDKPAYDFLAKSSLEGGEIIISNVGEYAGKAFLCPKLNYPMSLAPNSIMLKTKENDKFYYYYFISERGYKQIRSIVNSSGQPKFNKTNFKELEIPHFDLEEQNKIANLLSTIDEIISTNKKIINASESHLKILYNYWFVQFDFPNCDDKPYRSSDGKMLYDELAKRDIPEGWCVKTIGDIIKEAKKSPVQVNEAKERPGNYPFFTSGDEIINFEDYYVDGFNIFLNTGGNADVKSFLGKSAYSTDTWCISAGVYSYLLSMFLMSIKDQINNNCFAGSGLKHLQKNAFKRIKIVLPPKELIEKFNSAAEKILLTKTQYELENKKLASLRDWLLPMLMNKQVEVNK